MSTGVNSWLSKALMCTVWCLWQASCPADLVLEISDVSIPYGSTGFVDVFVKSTAAGGESLAAWDMTFEISGPVANGSLDFVATQPDISGIASPVPYVFLIDTGGYGSFSPSNNPPDFTFSDYTDDGAGNPVNVSLSSGVNYLLARISLVHLGGSSAIGDQFTVSLASYGFSYDSAGSSLPLTLTNSGLTFTVFVTAPEPSAIGLLLPGFGLALWLRRRRQKTVSRPGGID